MKTKIPAQTIVKCDVCQKECDSLNRREEGELIINRASRCYLGDKQGVNIESFDLCDTCLNHLTKTLNEEIEHIRSITDATKPV